MQNGDSPYVVLGLDELATPEEVSKAYKKLALKWHPDKNQNKDEKTREYAAKMFALVAEANTILSDEKARAAYEALVKAKQAQKARADKLGAAAKQARVDLEAREQEASRQKTANAEAQLRREIARLRAETAFRLEEERMRAEMQAEIAREQQLLQQQQEQQRQSKGVAPDGTVDYGLEDYETAVLERLRLVQRQKEMRAHT
eukprot:m.133425 g.133425  ORF g.133425 m.133425 type:complete len:202 (-) comp16511_c0_seq2:2196-2801(-)